MNAKWMWTIGVRPEEDGREDWDNALFWACVFSGLWLLCRCLTGLVAGFSASYSLEELPGTVLACLGTGLACLLREGIRSWVIRFFRCGARHPALLGALLAMDFGLLGLSSASIPQVNHAAGAYQLLIGGVLPGLVASVLLTVLAYYGGLLPALVYSLVTEMVPPLLPVTPGRIWLLELLVGVLLPLLFLMILCMQYDKRTEAPPAEGEKPAGWQLWLARAGEGLFLLALTGFVAFFLGVLPWHPLAVATGSMEPLIQPGDMAILADVQPEELAEGDVIQFRRENYMVLHRIVEVREEEDGTVSYITQGDANNAPDEQPVAPEDVTGRLMGKVPGIGWITLWMRSE